jgi:hypothetical protein
MLVKKQYCWLKRTIKKENKEGGRMTKHTLTCKHCGEVFEWYPSDHDYKLSDLNEDEGNYE